MALSDKNIIITPNTGQSSDPVITFSGANANISAQTISLKTYPTNSGTLSFEGSAGQLFSVTNSLSGTIFSVNDVSGIPSITVADTGQIKLAPYSGYVTLGNNQQSTSTTTGVLQVSGGASITSNLYVGGNIVLPNANTTTSLLVITNNNFGWDGAGTQHGGTGYIYFNQAGASYFQTSVISRSSIQNDQGNKTVLFSGTGNVYVANTSSSTSTTTGALTVGGGAGISANIYVGGLANITAAPGTATGSSALTISGNVGRGGAGYHDFLGVFSTAGGVTTPNKYFRLSSTGDFEIINSAYSARIFALTDAGALTVGSSPAATDNTTTVATTAFVRNQGGKQNQAYFTTGTSATWTVPTGITKAKVTVVGGGGGGGGVTAVAGAAGGGGGAGGIATAFLVNLAPGSTVTYSVGAAGTAGTNAGGTGGTGGTSSIVIGGVTIISCAGGTGGVGSTAASQNRAGGSGGAVTLTGYTTANVVAITGSAGFGSIETTAAATSNGGNGGAGFMGAGAGLGISGATGQGGAGATGTGAGGGGANGASANTGGAGGAGAVIFEY